MDVKDLRKLLDKMPGEMPVYNKEGQGISHAIHVFKGNLVGMDQYCSLSTYFEDPEENMQDSLIEQETGFKSRRELLDAYKALKDSES